MRITTDARRSIVFFGVPGIGGGTEYGGTGFLLADCEDGIYIPFLITARHVAEALSDYQDTGFTLRANTKSGSEPIPFQSLNWRFHPDPTVDLAATFLALGNQVFDVSYFPLRGSEYGESDRIARWDIDGGTNCGDPMSIVGLFRLHYGKQRNVPMVHSGHIAALPDPNEKVPVKNRKTGQIIESEVYLVEAQTLEGLSGSPVFTHEVVSLELPVKGQQPMMHGAMVLLGIYTGAWDGNPGEILAKDRNLHGGIRVPVGMEASYLRKRSPS